MDDAEKSMNVSKEKITTFDNSIRKINNSENDSYMNQEILKKFSYSRYVSLFRQDFDMSNLEKWSELICQKSPKRRCYHVSFNYKEYLYVFAGMDINEGKMNDLFRVSMNPNNENFLKWEEVTIPNGNPNELSYLQGALDEETGKFYIFGGENVYQRYPNDLYILDLEKKNWEKKTFKEEIIFGLTGHSLNYHNDSNSLFMFGGFAKGVYLNDVFVYDIKQNLWTKINYEQNIENIPIGRMLHASTILNNSLYIYGGKTGDGIYLNDIWKFDLNLKTWEEILVEGEVPKGRSGHSLICYENSLYIFGGKVGDLQERNEFWKFDTERKVFSLIHDTMLEQHSDPSNDISIALKDISKKQNKKMGKTLSNKTNDQFLTESQKQKYEDMILNSPNTKKMKNSMIYKLEGTGNNVFKSRATIFISEKSSANIGPTDKIRSGIVPAPRDGHTMNIFGDKIIIFGGDRNKFPYNDLFTFNIN